ncbi:DUF1648 domain-containing protein [Acetobacterium paludosum]|uniref:DUF1648 domain-containing protein n=1 Tax=Acetobacterium paludosum TaxID=52693 RepID=A0A923I0N9_9FIRM|nr:DUF1648 domain-containing protein [Acetobacterium paludosum]MBC3887953.1 DUF1648 domain-containing protein [Acetobacterium paludosum]
MNNSLNLITGVMGLSWVLVVFATAFTPYFVRKNICFGISIPESEYDNPQFKALRRDYSIGCLATGLIIGIGSAVCYRWIPAEKAMWIQIEGMFLYLVISMLMYFFMRSKIKAIKQASDWKIETKTVTEISQKSDKTINIRWYLVYLAIIAITVLATVLKYPSLPEQIPVHFNIAGEVDRYAQKSIGTVAIMPVIQLLIGMLFAAINVAIRMSKRQGNFQKSNVFRGVMSMTLFAIGLMVMLLLTCVQFSMMTILSEKLISVLPLAFLIAIFVICAYLAIKVGQGGSRLKGTGNQPENMIDDDSHWIGGFLYFNKNDPSLFVEKRFGIGYTLNFGNKKSLIAIGVIIVLIGALLALPFILK